MFSILKHAQSSLVLANNVRTITTSSVCFAEPLRKKKNLNPLITKKQYDRKVRRLEKDIGKLESVKPKLKPILELSIGPQVKREIDSRVRQEKDEISEKLLKSYYRVWSIYKSLESSQELQLIQGCVKAQEKALNVLRRDYPELYNEAIQLDSNLIPFKISNPKKETPPIENYNCPDGKEIDVTKEWKL